MMLIEHWSPVTSDLGLIQAPLEQVSSAIIDWQEDLGHLKQVHKVNSGLSKAFEALLPLSAGMRRRLLVATRTGWTAQFQSGIQGSDPFPVMSLFAQRLGVLAMRVCSTPEPSVFPANIWEVYGPSHLGGGELGYLRTVCAVNDGGRWVFDQSGKPFEFEELSSYAKRRKRDRFTRELLVTYLAEFGLAPFRDDFYTVNPDVPAIVLERPAWVDEPTEFTLEEVRQGAPWSRS